MIYITGDKHGDFSEILDFCKENKTNKKDLMIVLGDACINYFADERDSILKFELKKYPITFFCVHGNHEERPENIKGYRTKKYKNGLVYYEFMFPNILFAKDAEVYNINGNKTLVIGGAYSVDKYYRLLYGDRWYPSEQPSEETKQKLKDVLKENNNKVDIILSHTCPYKYTPTEMFLEGLDQSTVDKTTEYFLDEIENNTEYNKWYCGHYHTDKEIDNMRFMYHDIEEFPKRLVKKR